MIKETLKKCVYYKNKRNIILCLIALITLSIIIIKIASLNYNTNYDNLEKNLKEINALNGKELALKVQETIKNNIDDYLKEYSIYYNLDGNKVVEFARNITENYNINLNDVGGRITSDTVEGQAMMFVYYLSRNQLSKSLSEYGLSSDYFKTNYDMITLGENQTLRSGLTFSQFLGKVCDNLGMDKNYLLSISYLETGKNTSGLALRSNNFGGLRGSGEYFTYESPEKGIIAFVVNLKGYEKYNLTSIYELSGIYTHGNKYNPSNTWVSSVYKYYDNIVNNPSEYFLVEGM